PMQVAVTSGTVTGMDEMLLIVDAKNGADFAIYAPVGSTWSANGGVYTSSLNGEDYMSVAFLPMECADLAQKAIDYKEFAYVFPTDTKAEYAYDEATSVVRTDFSVTTEVMEGAYDKVLMGLLPHQWSNLASDCAVVEGDSYTSIRGEIKSIVGNSFSVENIYYGILPTLPAVCLDGSGYSDSVMSDKLTAMKDDEIGDWTDSYNDGQLLNRLVQSARIAAETGNNEAHEALLNTIQERLEDWLSYEQGEVAFLFYYIDEWSTLVGYPAGHSQDSNLNDHHFHWGYFIHAAAFMEQYRPGWADKWGGMVDLLVRDAASSNREDDMFPYLRNFSPYAGHCWANGFATFPQGNDQESTSESMQFNSSLIHWGTITGNDEIRDLGIYLYTTEQSAVEEYWFDMYERTFTSSQAYSVVSRIWGNSLDNGTFWTTDLAASYGIELYPIHGGSLYLGHNIEYAEKLWSEIKSNTGITVNEANDNLWHDTMWKYAAFVDAAEAVEMYDSYPDRSLKFGMSDAQTYYWLHSMYSLGNVSTDVTADYAVAAAFDRSGRMSYVAHNYKGEDITVTYSDGFQMVVPAGSMMCEQVGDMLPDVKITSPESGTKHMTGTQLTIEATAYDYTEVEISEVNFYINDELIGCDISAPYSIEWSADVNGTFSIMAEAVNANGITGTSKVVNVEISDETADVFTSNEALQGSFSVGYNASFETIAGNVEVIFELLDTDKEGVVAYLWHEYPFSESMMTSAGDNTFKTTLIGYESGEELSLACKFAYAGGMSVTKYFDYTVGESSGVDSNSIDAAKYMITADGQLKVITVAAETVALYTVDGQTAYTKLVNGEVTIKLNKGIYILKIGNDCYKIIV
ncbi:MAG: glycosyl hydrolase, partial [Bacteroidales bacterium]